MIKIAVSACLLGKNVRYDGKNKAIALKNHFDPHLFTLEAICPEVEMGLSIPRPPIELIKLNSDIRLVQVGDHQIDFTQKMHNWFKNKQKQLDQYAGFILKSRSPSCGHQNTQHFNINGPPDHNGDGLFTMMLKQFKPHLAIISEKELHQADSIKNFLKKANPQ